MSAKARNEIGDSNIVEFCSKLAEDTGQQVFLRSDPMLESIFLKLCAILCFMLKTVMKEQHPTQNRLTQYHPSSSRSKLNLPNSDLGSRKDLARMYKSVREAKNSLLSKGG